MKPIKQVANTPFALLERSAAVSGRVFASVEDPDGGIHVVTYADELARVRRTAAALAKLGIRSGDRVHIHLDNCLEFFDLWFATELAGAALVPTNPLCTAAELRHFITNSSSALSVTSERHAEVVHDASSSIKIVTIDGVGRDGLATYVDHSVTPPDFDAQRAKPDSVAAILYTSGTTSRPKGVLVTHANYVAVGRAVARHIDVTADDRWLVVLPLFHANAQYYCTMSALTAGASIALMPRFSASRWSDQAAQHRATLASLFAAPIRMILRSEARDGDADNRLRAVLFAQNISDTQAAEFETRFATRLLQLYGMTETVIPPTINPNSPSRRWRSIGQAMPGIELWLEGPDGKPALVGDVGEMVVQGVPGQTMALGYLGQPESTAEAFASGWLRTGDLAVVDSNGFYTFVDRAKDMVKRSGENVALTEIDAVVDEHPGVLESAAIGVPDPIRDQAIVVFVVADPEKFPTEADLTDWCRKLLAPFKVPSKFVFVDALPRTSVGKVNRQALRIASASGSHESELES